MPVRTGLGEEGVPYCPVETIQLRQKNELDGGWEIVGSGRQDTRRVTSCSERGGWHETK